MEGEDEGELEEYGQGGESDDAEVEEFVEEVPVPIPVTYTYT